MNFKNYLFFLIIFLLSNCTSNIKKNSKTFFTEDRFSNKGFTLIFNENLFNEKIINKKIDVHSLQSYLNWLEFFNGKSTFYNKWVRKFKEWI